jgi:hypothetical protein
MKVDKQYLQMCEICNERHHRLDVEVESEEEWSFLKQHSTLFDLMVWDRGSDRLSEGETNIVTIELIRPDPLETFMLLGEFISE